MNQWQGGAMLMEPAQFGSTLLREHGRTADERGRGGVSSFDFIEHNAAL